MHMPRVEYQSFIALFCFNRCLIYIKTTVYERIHNDGKSRTKYVVYSKVICAIITSKLLFLTFIIRKLACKSIASYMKSGKCSNEDSFFAESSSKLTHIIFALVCQILNDMKLDMTGSICIEMSDLKWLMQTAYNLGLFCFSVGRNEEGGLLLGAIELVHIFCWWTTQLTPTNKSLNKTIGLKLLWCRNNKDLDKWTNSQLYFSFHLL